MNAPVPKLVAAVVAVSVLGTTAVSQDTKKSQGKPAGAAAKKQDKKKPPFGYTDTPFIPGSKWRVHDAYRPQPRIVEPGTNSTPDKPGKPPSDAVVLFDGTDLSKWTGKGGKAGWKVENGYMEVNRTGDIRTKEQFGDCQLHIEWASPKEVRGKDQGRGNSGVYLMGRYEIQVLDCRDNKTYPDGQAASMYGQSPPLVNACRKPGEWQSYDIIFKAPRFEGKKLLDGGYVTVLHNGVVVHHHQRFIGQSGHRNVPGYKPHPATGPIKLQDHGNPVRYRNIWIRPLKDYDAQ